MELIIRIRSGSSYLIKINSTNFSEVLPSIIEVDEIESKLLSSELTGLLAIGN